ncbi:MAG TPA: PhzF family phenazine biosynthesis protein [Ktedonobacterales bacterium]|jgi:PhzF family phenazine biosynthesis protein
MRAFRHVDVFTRAPFSGNGLTVFPESAGLSAAQMQRVTQEMRQFESIFLVATEDAHEVLARVFTVEEELDFAGHPVLGAACVLHECLAEAGEREVWRIRLNRSVAPVTTVRHEGWYSATMEQDAPVFGEIASPKLRAEYAAALSLTTSDLDETLPLQMVSTGLPYLLVPMRRGLERARIAHPAFEALLGQIGAKFVYVFDPHTREGRTWDNAGLVEDVATGSAAGPTAAYLVRYGLAQPETELVLAQGRFVGRPSQITARVAGSAEAISGVSVGGDVCMVGSGEIVEPAGAAGAAGAEAQ